MKKFLKMSKATLISAIVAAVVITLLITLRIEWEHSFEYPSFLGCRELRICGIPVRIEKNKTALSDFIARKNITIQTEKNQNFTVGITVRSLKGRECILGGVGHDLSKLCYIIKAEQISDEKVLHIINLLSEEKFNEFHQEVFYLPYEKR